MEIIIGILAILLLISVSYNINSFYITSRNKIKIEYLEALKEIHEERIKSCQENFDGLSKVSNKLLVKYKNVVDKYEKLKKLLSLLN